jgi:hypothetical protein
LDASDSPIDFYTGVACKFTVDAETTTLLIQPSKPLAAGDHVVCVRYSGILNDLMCGTVTASHIKEFFVKP